MSLEQPSAPADVQPNAFLPSTIPPLVFEDWNGISTSTNRAGVDDKQAYWLDGFFPIAPRNLQTLYGVGTALYTAGGGRTIIFFTFYNIGATPYMAVFLDNGSVVQVNVNTQATTTILPASTISNPSITTVGTSQWGSQFLIIVAQQTAPGVVPGGNGYWLWDGVVLYGPGTVGPLITITNVGSGYQTVPNIVASGGHGSGFAASAQIANGQVTSVSITNPGSGYLAGDTISLTFTGGNSAGSGGTLTAILTHATGGSGGSITLGLATAAPFAGAKVIGATIVASGSGYSALTTATAVSSPGNIAATPAVLTLTITGGAITAVTITNAGVYPLLTPVPTVTITDNAFYYVSSVTVNNAGSGYSASAVATASAGGGPISQASLKLNLTSGSIASVTVNSGGVYGSNTPPTVTVTDAAINAAATATLMPFAIQGTWAETYQGHVWVGNGAVVYFSAPGSYVDFSTSNGGGNFTSADSFLKVNYVQGINANGFLWLIGDSSVNYISGVQTSGSPITTTFSNQNADPEVGSPYPASVETFGRDVLMANAYGVHVINGSNVVKISEPLDGVWNTVASFGSLQLSSSKAQIFGKKVWMVLNRIVDPIAGTTLNKLFLWWNKKWFASAQDMTLIYVKHLEIQSVITAYGTDGSTIKPLFNTASTGFQKVAQSKLWDTPGSLLLNKVNTRFWAAGIWNSVSSPNLIVSIDSERNASPYATPTSTYTITGPVAVGYSLTPPQAVGQQSVFTGMTIKTSSADMQLIAGMMDAEPVQYRG